MEPKTYWNKIRHLLKQKEMTQKELASKCHMPLRTLEGWMYKNMYPSFVDGYKIAVVLGVTVEDMLGRKKPQKENNANKKIVKIHSLIRHIDQKLKEIHR